MIKKQCIASGHRGVVTVQRNLGPGKEKGRKDFSFAIKDVNGKI